MNILLELQKWYQSQCNGQWEHDCGINIGNLDNPGWEVKIDLIETELENKIFEKVERNISDEDWIFCKVENSKFIGYADSQKLEEILRIFLNWSKT